MKKIEIFEGSVCCGGACGGHVNQDSVRVGNTLAGLAEADKIDVAHHDLQEDPYAFLANLNVATAVQSIGIPALPLTVVDEIIVKMGDYPTDTELQSFAAENYQPISAFDPEQVQCGCGHACSCSPEEAVEN